MNENPVALSSGHRDFLQRKQERCQAIRQKLHDWYPGPERLVLEIGCGHGHYLTAFAEQYPESRCLGIDLVTKRIEKACRKRDKRNLSNLHFLKAEVREFLQSWPDHLGLERVFILFPDPWPKKRHTKNRILQPALLESLAGLSGPGTLLHFRTDHQATFAWGREQVDAHPSWTLDATVEWPFENPSFFQDLFSHYQSLSAVRI